MNEINKIGLIGSAGIGKGSIASKIGNKLDLFFLKSKDITRPILEKYNYDEKYYPCVEKFLSHKNIEFEIVNTRMQKEYLLQGGFITDRTTLECFVYALLSVESYEDKEITELENICRENMKQYNYIFYFPFKNGWLEDNGIRTVNNYFQWKIDLMIRGLINDWNINAITVPAENPIDFIINKIKQE